MRFNKRPIPTLSWVPTLTGFTIGAGTMTANYQQNGTIVTFQIRITLGTGFTFAGNPRFSTPIAVASGNVFGDCYLADVSAGLIYPGSVRSFAANQGQMLATVTSAARATLLTVTALDPFTFDVGDTLIASGTMIAQL